MARRCCACRRRRRDNASWRAGASGSTWCGGSRSTSMHWGSRSSMRSREVATWARMASSRAPGGNCAQLPKVQGEYMHREETGDLRSIPAMRRLRRLPQHAVRLVPAGRYRSAALAGGPAQRRARCRHAGDRPRVVWHAHRGGFPVVAAGRSESHDRDGRLEPERVFALAPAIRLGRGARRRAERPAAQPPIPVRDRRARRPQVLGISIMKDFIRCALALLFLSVALPSQAAIRVLATTADWGALAAALGGDHVDVYTATTAMGRASRGCSSVVARARRPGRREWRRARSRLAASCSGIRQHENPARRGLLRGDLGTDSSRVPQTRPRWATSMPRQPARQARPAQHRDGRGATARLSASPQGRGLRCARRRFGKAGAGHRALAG